MLLEFRDMGQQLQNKARLYHMYGKKDDSSEDYGGVISQTNNNEAEEVVYEDCHISLHGQTFEADLRVLMLGGCDMVLGVEWLRRYSPITFDYDLTEGTIHQYKNVFDEPKGLPPARRHDHKIPLKEGSRPISQRPYRIPYLQKSEIEKQVKEILSSGIIQYNNNPFASPVLLVLKKDGTWRVAEDDNPKTAFRTHHGHFEFKFGRACETFGGGVTGAVADPKKIEVMKLWPTPMNIKQLRGFLGLTETSFNQLKGAMINTLVLRFPDFTLPFTVETDACNVGVGAVLMQQGQPIAFLSKGLSKKNQMLSTYEKELLAVVMAINKWRPYLQGHHFIIKTDQQSLKYFLEQRVTSLIQKKWLAKLMGLDYEIVYKKGTENKVADALSMLPLAEGECNMITTITPTWITEIGSSYEGDGAATEFLMLATDKENSRGWSLQQGLLKRDSKIFVGSSGVREDISMDFIEGLRRSRRKDTIFVVVDRFTKYSHFNPLLTHPFSSMDVAQAFLDNVYKLHGLPKTIVSDRDRLFLSPFWQELFKLPLAEWWYNTTRHSSIGMSPFELLYGITPRQFNLPDDGEGTSVATVGEFFTKRNILNKILKEALTHAQNRYKMYADKSRTEREFDVGDWVYLKLQPYRQSSVEVRRNLKLSCKHFGPYQVLERIGKVAYKLDLPIGSQIHPVFHVSLLKKKIGEGKRVVTNLPKVGKEGQFLFQPELILERKMIKRGNKAVPQMLV
uniref:Reverse transcriptase n=1 Tax=Tanacetum cinerariifolium TaxID=118510 RepID=A0A699ISK4_TANCI|nr:reverse transcriptase [Tanacetum cinerariifolium]